MTRYNTSSVVSQGCVTAGRGFMHAVQQLLWHPAASCDVSTAPVRRCSQCDCFHAFHVCALAAPFLPAAAGAAADSGGGGGGGAVARLAAARALPRPIR